MTTLLGSWLPLRRPDWTHGVAQNHWALALLLVAFVLVAGWLAMRAVDRIEGRHDDPPDPGGRLAHLPRRGPARSPETDRRAA